MDKLSLHNPLFATYVIAATLMILKAVSMSWLTVVRMMQVKGGFRSPEDIRKTPLNPHPEPKQIEPDDRVDRIRRIQMNDLENLPYFLAAGFGTVRPDRSTADARALAAVRIRRDPAAALLGLLHGADPRSASRPMDARIADPGLHDRSDLDRRAGLLTG